MTFRRDVITVLRWCAVCRECGRRSEPQQTIGQCRCDVERQGWIETSGEWVCDSCCRYAVYQASQAKGDKP